MHSCFHLSCYRLMQLPASCTPEKTIAPLQRVQNAAARLTLRMGRFENARLFLKELGWLPVKRRITFKTATLAFRYRLSSPLAPKYLSSLLSSHVPSRSLRSSNNTSLSAPRVRLSTYGAKNLSPSSLLPYSTPYFLPYQGFPTSPLFHPS